MQTTPKDWHRLSTYVHQIDTLRRLYSVSTAEESNLRKHVETSLMQLEQALEADLERMTSVLLMEEVARKMHVAAEADRLLHGKAALC